MTHSRKMTDHRANKLAHFLPCLTWGRAYTPAFLTSDLVAAAIVTVMLIPQSLAYALLAGLPAQVGLYASIGPLLAYTIFGTSRTLAVGPVAVVSLLTAAAVSQVASPGSAEYLGAAMLLALLSGGFLFLLGVLRLGFLANLLSHPVIAGFIAASGILIAVSQMKHVLGISVQGHSVVEMGASLISNIQQTNIPTLMIGVSVMAFLLFVRKFLQKILQGAGMSAQMAGLVTKIGPIFAVVASTVAVYWFDLDGAGVRIVGEIPKGLPALGLPPLNIDLMGQLLPAAILISLIGFVESVSVGQTLAAKRRQRIEPDQELIALGAANAASAISGGFPVTGGFSRSVVNFDAGAQTPLAGAFTAAGIAIAAIFLTPLFYYLPIATLAATIIIAVLSLIEPKIFAKAWAYSKSDFAAMMATILVTLGLGVEQGVVTGVGVSVLLHLWRTSRPHIAVVGLVPGTQHFRNIHRHEVIHCPHILSVRVDESLYFANARYLEDTVYRLVAEDPELRHFVLLCSAVNEIDGSALETLEAINQRLQDANVTMHLSEVKGPVMDRLKRSHFLKDLTGQVALSHYHLICALNRECLCLDIPCAEEGQGP